MIEPEAPYDDFEDKSGMTVVSGTVTLKKNHENLIGISIGGGAPFCPCLYIVQLYDKTPAFTDASLQCGDEIVAINGTNVKGLSKTELAKLIQGAEDQVTVQYNKLICDTKRVSQMCTQTYRTPTSVRILNSHSDQSCEITTLLFSGRPLLVVVF